MFLFTDTEAEELCLVLIVSIYYHIGKMDV